MPSYFSNMLDYIKKPRISILNLAVTGVVTVASSALYYYSTREAPKTVVEKTGSWAWDTVISIPVALFAALTK